MPEETSRVFRDENGDRLSEPDEVVLPSALEKSSPLVVGPADRLPLHDRQMLESLQNQARIRRDVLRQTFQNHTTPFQERCEHVSGLGYSTIVSRPTLDGGDRQICTRCNHRWVSTGDQNAYNDTYQQALAANQTNLLGALGGGTVQGGLAGGYTSTNPAIDTAVDSLAQEMSYRLGESLRSLSEATTPTDQETTAQMIRTGVVRVVPVGDSQDIALIEQPAVPEEAFSSIEQLNDEALMQSVYGRNVPDRWEGAYGWNTTLGVSQPNSQQLSEGSVDIPEPKNYVSPRKRSFLSRMADKVRGIKPWTRDLADIAKEVTEQATEGGYSPAPASGAWCPAHPLDDCYCEGCIPPHRPACGCDTCIASSLVD